MFNVSPLLRALIIEAGSLAKTREREYAGRVTALILDQLRREQPVSSALPWPSHPALLALCEALYANPADLRGVDTWGQRLGMSPRTLTRRFEHEVGMSLRAWRRRLRLFKAVELLGGGLAITQIGLDLGYASSSAFTYMFRKEMGCSPLKYRRNLTPMDRRGL